MEKLIKDGFVAVLVSPGFGAGWSTWLYGNYLNDPLFDPVLAQMILDNVDYDELSKVAAERYPEGYLGGLEQLEVRWLPVDTKFRVDEYDGAESIEICDDIAWIIA